MRNESREKIIEGVISDLRSYNIDNADIKYAINELIIFFNASRNFYSYLFWLIFRAPHLDKNKIKEVTDFPFNYWDEKMHRLLIKMESKKFPGLISLIVNEIVNFILKSKKEDLIFTSLGCGGMEVERQVIKKLIEKKSNKKIIFVGVDISPMTQKIARENLADFVQDMEFTETKEINSGVIEKIRSLSEKRYKIIFAGVDIFSLVDKFPNKYFDLVYHSLFKHHLSISLKNKLDGLAKNLAQEYFEYDGYKSWLQMMPQTIVAWKDPVFLSANIFSNLRFFYKKELKKKNKNIKFSKAGYYLLKHGNT